MFLTPEHAAPHAAESMKIKQLGVLDNRLLTSCWLILILLAKSRQFKHYFCLYMYCVSCWFSLRAAKYNKCVCITKWLTVQRCTTKLQTLTVVYGICDDAKRMSTKLILWTNADDCFNAFASTAIYWQYFICLIALTKWSWHTGTW